MYEIYNDIITIRRKVFREIAELAYRDANISEELDKSVFRIIPGEMATYRDSVFKERAIVGERLRLALGLPIRDASALGDIKDGLEEADISERFYMDPLVNVITFACEACPTKALKVTDNCRKCIAHPCINVCPVKAVSMGKNSAVIDQTKCIKCGKCKEACPYHAIVQYDRPCAASCGVNAIGSDHMGRAQINHDKCVSCGQCLSHCPFGAIADKSQIYQLIKDLKKGGKHLAIVAPSFVSQFGPIIKPEQVFEGIKALGFSDVMEVGLGADIETIKEAKEYLEKVPVEREYLGTSCCPSWAKMVENMFPDQVHNISNSATPMVATARYIKKEDEKSKVTFIGPCISKKLEALRPDVRDCVDFVITFEELMGMFVAKNIELSSIEVTEELNDASTLGRGFAASGGVANAVASVIKSWDPDREITMEKANGLHECVKLVKSAKAGQKKGFLLEGMACMGGCIGGPGVLAPQNKALRALNEFKDRAKSKLPMENEMIKEKDK